MKQQEFISTHLNDLISKDKDIMRYFERAKTDNEKNLLTKGLEQSLEAAYNAYAKQYFESGKIGRYVSKIMRGLALGADMIGTYAFWALGGAGCGFKGLGILGKLAAEAIDNRHYEKTKGIEGIVTKDGLSLAGEAFGQVAAGFAPYGGELWAFLRGQKKYDEKIIKHALYFAKSEFIKRFGDVLPEKKELKLVPLEDFVDQRYGKPALSPA
ncbi:MAG: hypothetical protein QXM31_04650 [Candidatus Woesearchaeota archaeon]